MLKNISDIYLKKSLQLNISYMVQDYIFNNN